LATAPYALAHLAGRKAQSDNDAAASKGEAAATGLSVGMQEEVPATATTLVLSALVSSEEPQEITMNKLTSAGLGLSVSIALSAGGVLAEHPLYTDQAPGAYSDITIAEADNQKIPPESADKTAKPSANPSTADVPPAVETTPGEESKGKAPVKP